MTQLTNLSKTALLALFWATLAIGSANAATSTPALSNDDVIAMAKAGLSVDLIAGQIRNSQTKFDMSTAEIIRLSKAGVPDQILTIMRNPGGSTPESAANPEVGNVKTPDGEKVRLTLDEDISSATANEGDRVNFTLAEDVLVEGVVIFAKGSKASGTITEARRKGMLGRGGRLAMSMDQVKAVDGQNVRLRATSGRQGDDKTGKTVVVAVLAGPFALLVKGKDIAASRGTEYTAYIDETKEIAVPLSGASASLGSIRAER